MKLILTLLTSLLLVSCNPKIKSENQDAKLYQSAIRKIKIKHFMAAGEDLSEIESEYPYSQYAAKAEVLNAFISYLSEEYQESHDQADKFIKLRPANKNISYMYFLRAISILELVRDRYRESETTMEAQRNFRELISRFPGSIYSETALEEIKKLEMNLAAHDIEIAKFYQLKRDYIAAIIRYQELLKSSARGEYIAEAHFRLVECYLSLGLIEEADYEHEILAQNHSDSKWFKYSKKLIIADPNIEQDVTEDND